MYTKTYKTFLSLLLLSLYTTVSRAELAESTILSTTLENQQHEQHNSADYVATLTPEIAACFMLLGSCFTDAMGSQALHIYNGLQQNNLQFSYSIIIPALIQILDLAHKKSKSEEIAPVVQDYFTKLLSGEALEKALEATVPVATLRSPIACVVDLLVRQSLQVGAYLTVGGAAVINELAVLNALRLPCNSISGEALIDNSVADCKLQTIVTPGKVANSATTATSSNIPNTIVLRDGSGNFSAGTITANLNGSATNFSGPLMGDVTGTQNATVVSFVGGQPAADVAAATVEVEQATSSNIPNTLVERDATGSFAAQDITVDGNINITNPSTVTEGNILKTGQLFIHNFGTDNTFVGLEAGNTTLTGSQNTAVGRLALQDSTSGSLNTALGSNALTNNTTGSGNTAVGGGALLTNSTGSDNVAIGSTTLFTNSTGSDNTAVGRSALLLNSTGSENTAVGRSALLTNMMGSENTAVGLSALLNNSTGNFNTALGRSALLSSTGNLNTAVGYQAGLSLPSGDSNIYVGANAGLELVNQILYALVLRKRKQLRL